MHSFIVDNTEVSTLAKEKILKRLKFFTEHDHWKELSGEVLYAPPIKTVGGDAPLFDAVSYAFNQHFPLERLLYQQ